MKKCENCEKNEVDENKKDICEECIEKVLKEGGKIR
ncbi:hypothetical protein LCGC14_0784140 [marine sediment metagenome]|uniref:Uncharacterized protein n=1 Tax=marine sediment metagenome TaxID=412755 RepID=A0A0F9QED6_9ZZZZ